MDDLIKGNYISRVRNVRVASAFKEAQLIERYGSGFKRIQQGFKMYGLKPPFFEELQGGFRVTVYSDKEDLLFKKVGDRVGDRVGDKVGEKLTDNQRKIITAISANKKISTAELSKVVGIANKNIETNVKKLKELGLLNRIGSAKGGYWEVKT